VKKPKESPLFVIAADNYKTEVLSLKKASTYYNVCYVVDKLVLEFGHLRIDQISKKDIQNLVSKLNVSVGAGAIRRYISVFRNICQWADEDFTLPRLVLPRKRRTQQDFYTVEEFRKLIKASSGEDKALIMLLAETGCRVGEAIGLQTRDLSGNTLKIERDVCGGILQDSPKTDSSVRSITISDQLVAELRHLILNGLECFIFRTPEDKMTYPVRITKMIKAVCEKAKVEYKSPHAFRRGNITALLIDLGLPERVVGARTGHLSQGQLLGVYCQAAEGVDKKYVPKIAELLYGGEE
jgi:integrase